MNAFASDTFQNGRRYHEGTSKRILGYYSPKDDSFYLFHTDTYQQGKRVRKRKYLSGLKELLFPKPSPVPV